MKESEVKINLAKGEAAAHRILQDSLSPEVLQNKAIERWDGKLPLFMDDNLLKSLELAKDKRKSGLKKT